MAQAEQLRVFHLPSHFSFKKLDSDQTISRKALTGGAQARYHEQFRHIEPNLGLALIYGFLVAATYIFRLKTRGLSTEAPGICRDKAVSRYV